MGPFTQWIGEWRNNNELPMTPDVAEVLAAKLYRELEAKLRRRLQSRFGLPTAEDMAGEQTINLLERLQDPERLLPEFVKDYPTLFVWMFRTSWSRFCKQCERDRSRPQEHGVSGMPKLANGSCDPLGMDTLQDLSGTDVELTAMADENVEAFYGALADLKQWCEIEALSAAHKIEEQDWVASFERVILDGEQPKQLAKALKVSEATLRRWIDRAYFCIGRRLGDSPAELIRAFGEKAATRWTGSLEAALRRKK